MRAGSLFLSPAVVLLAALAFISPLRGEPPAAEPAWIEDAGDGLARARQEGKPVLVDIWAVWCAPCKEMDLTTYRDPEVVSELERFVPLKIDADRAKNFIERYRIEAYPTVLFLDGEGKEISRLTGFIEAKEMRARTRAVADGYAEYRQLGARGNEAGATAWLGRYLLAAGNPEEACRQLEKALKRTPAAEREGLELDLARAELAAGDAKRAAAHFASLADGGSTREIRAAALEGLADAEEQRGREDAAQAARERLRSL